MPALSGALFFSLSLSVSLFVGRVGNLRDRPSFQWSIFGLSINCFYVQCTERPAKSSAPVETVLKLTNSDATNRKAGIRLPLSDTCTRYLNALRWSV